MSKLSILMSSSVQNVSEVEDFAEKVRDHYGIGLDKYPDILISLTEAVNNAIHHGNNCDAEKYVTIRSKCDDGNLSLEVTDEGPGFDPADIPDPRNQQHIADCNGRGVFLMRELCDCLNYRDNGRTVEMTFYLHP